MYHWRGEVQYDSDSSSSSDYDRYLPPIERTTLHWPISKRSVVKLPINSRRGSYEPLLLTTGSEISLMRVDRYNMPPDVCYGDAMPWECSPDGTVNTLGTAMYYLCFGRTILEHEFHLIPDDVNLEEEGILGMDFVLKYGVSFDFQRYLITMHFD